MQGWQAGATGVAVAVAVVSLLALLWQRWELPLLRQALKQARLLLSSSSSSSSSELTHLVVASSASMCHHLQAMVALLMQQHQHRHQHQQQQQQQQLALGWRTGLPSNSSCLLSWHLAPCWLLW